VHASVVTSRKDERLRTVFEAHRGALSAYLSRLGVPLDERDDVHQEVLLIVASKLEAVTPGSERAFLFATAQRVASNARRGLRRRLRKADRLSSVEADPLPSIEDLIDQLHARALLDDALDETPGDARLVFLLHELNGVALGEIAKRLGLPAGTVASRVRRARASLDEWVRKKEGGGAASSRAGAVDRSPSRPDRGDPEILSWWVSGGETHALRALVRVFERAHPNASVVSAAVSGTTSAKQQLLTRMSRGTPPDTFQVNGGIDLHRWVRRGSCDRMESLDFLF
jgi:RNA polymerase sigma-70 factor (ECF subfamily)